MLNYKWFSIGCIVIFLYNYLPSMIYPTKHIKLDNSYIQITGKINDTDSIIKLISNTTDQKIYLYINSAGGSAYAGTKLIANMLKQQISGKIFVCLANDASSIAFDIFQTCDVRYVSDKSFLFQHNVQIHFKGSINMLRELIPHLNYIEEILNKLDYRTAKKMKISYKTYKNKLEETLSAKSCKQILNLYLADTCVTVKSLLPRHLNKYYA